MQYKIFGCKVNKYYTDKWLNSTYLKDKKGIFIASCVVTDQAKRKWIKFVKDIIKNEELEQGHKIFISGCGAFKNGKAQDDFFDLYPDLESLKGKIEILGEDPEEKILKNKQEIKKSNLEKLKSDLVSRQMYTKKFVLIQGGCDSFCSFCLTVIKRGRHYYRSKEDIVEDINDFVQKGGKEVVLTGVNLAAWGLETTNPKQKVEDINYVQSRLPELLDYILENTKIQRLRISSLGPEFVNKACLQIFENKRIYPHFHFSIQSGSNNVLENMKRHYSRDYMKKLLLDLRAIKREDDVYISIGADIIVGFPGETNDDFKDTLDLIKDCNITKVHAFPFSAHKFGENVPAGFYKNQIADDIKKDRMHEIMILSEQIRDDFIDENIGREFELLIETVKVDIYSGFISWKGWTQNYIEADQNNFEIISGEIKKNEIVKGILIK